MKGVEVPVVQTPLVRHRFRPYSTISVLQFFFPFFPGISTCVSVSGFFVFLHGGRLKLRGSPGTPAHSKTQKGQHPKTLSIIVLLRSCVVVLLCHFVAASLCSNEYQLSPPS